MNKINTESPERIKRNVSNESNLFYKCLAIIAFVGILVVVFVVSFEGYFVYMNHKDVQAIRRIKTEVTEAQEKLSVLETNETLSYKYKDEVQQLWTKIKEKKNEIAKITAVMQNRYEWSHRTEEDFEKLEEDNERALAEHTRYTEKLTEEANQRAKAKELESEAKEVTEPAEVPTIIQVVTREAKPVEEDQAEEARESIESPVPYEDPAYHDEHKKQVLDKCENTYNDIPSAVPWIHNRLNSFLQNDLTPDQSEYHECSLLGEHILKLSEQAELDSLKNDLVRLGQYLCDGASKENALDIIDAHNIAHDLDCHYYENDVDAKYFGATETVSR